jgi:hypothetical protein
MGDESEESKETDDDGVWCHGEMSMLCILEELLDKV